ncbi:MAG: aminoacyl-tRNA hydrolase [Treponema sp.]|jgi:PTH1 family peptidyl-tRNA hydrolase|nr:aminoacyl-tRNA hydrolase [Treponema sp.]
MLQLAVFLGNPGSQYKNNRHNAAWMLAETLPFYSSLDWQKKFKGLYAAMDGFHFLKPQTYMNLSGESAQAAASFFKIKLEDIIVIHDEIELPFGTLSLKFSGGMGGHNGLRSMKAVFGSADFWRLRIGIGRPDDRLPGKGGNPESSRAAGIAGWVLADFTPPETEALAPVLVTGAGLLAKTLAVEPQSLLPEWAKKNCAAV